MTRCEWCGRDGTAVHDPDTGTYTCRYCGGARTRPAAPKAPGGLDCSDYDSRIKALKEAAERREEVLQDYRRRYGCDYDDGNATACDIFIGGVAGVVIAIVYAVMAGLI